MSPSAEASGEERGGGCRRGGFTFVFTTGLRRTVRLLCGLPSEAGSGCCCIGAAGLGIVEGGGERMAVVAGLSELGTILMRTGGMRY